MGKKQGGSSAGKEETKHNNPKKRHGKSANSNDNIEEKESNTATKEATNKNVKIDVKGKGKVADSAPQEKVTPKKSQKGIPKARNGIEITDVYKGKSGLFILAFYIIANITSSY